MQNPEFMGMMPINLSWHLQICSLVASPWCAKSSQPQVFFSWIEELFAPILLCQWTAEAFGDYGSPTKSVAEQGPKPASLHVPVLYHFASYHMCCFSKRKGFGEESLLQLEMESWLFEPFLAFNNVTSTGFLLSLKLTNVVYHIKCIYPGYVWEEEGWTSP